MSIFTNSNNKNIYYEVLGDKNSNNVVCFFNGIMASTDSWKFQVSLFEKLGYKIVLHDFIGQQKSDGIDGPSYTLSEHASDFNQLLSELKVERIHLIGTSYGGEVAQRFAIDYPEKIKTLTLIDTVSELSAKLRYHARLWQNITLEENGENLIKGLFPEIYGNTFMESNPKVLEHIARQYAELPSHFYDGLYKLLQTFLEDVNLTPELHKITAPCLILCGQEDVVKPPKFSKIINSKIANSEYLEIPDCGHVAFIEKINEVNSALLGFITKNL